MAHRRLVAAGDQGGGPVPGADVLQGADDVDLPDHPLAGVLLAECQVADRQGAAAVDADVAAAAPHVEQVLVDGDAVDGVDPAAAVADPGRVVDQAPEHRPAFDDVLEVAAVGVAVGVGLDVADPLPGSLSLAAAAFHVAPVVVDPLVHFVEVLPGDPPLDDDVAVEVEQVVDQVLVPLAGVDPIPRHGRFILRMWSWLQAG